MYIFIKKIFCIGSLFLSCLLSAIPLNAIPLRCFSWKNQGCKVTPKAVDININNPIFYPYNVEINVVIVIILMIHMQKFVFLIL